MLQKTLIRVNAAVLSLLLVAMMLSGCHHSEPNYVAAPPHLNIIQRHPTLSSMGAGYAAYKASKMTGQNREAMGGHKNFMQRHPILTGVAAAALTHHMIKRSIQH